MSMTEISEEQLAAMDTARELSRKTATSTANHDPVNHPTHYTSHPSGVECITITRHMGFNLGNAMKYIWRADLKDNSIQDLEKAAFYIADEISKRKGKATPSSK